MRLWIDEIPEVLFTIQCNTKHYPSVVLLIMLYEVVLTFESVDEILWCGHSNETSSAVRSHSVIYYFNLLVLTIEPVDEILWCDHSNETSSAFIWHGPLLGCLGLNDSTGILH